MEELATLLHSLTLTALRLEAANAAQRAERAQMAPLIEAVEASLPRLGSLDRTRTRDVLGRIRHALGVEVRDALPSLIAVVRGVPTVDVGAAPGEPVWFLLIIEAGRYHTAALDADDLVQLQALRRNAHAHGELRIWLADPARATALGAAGIAVEIGAAALLRALEE